MSRKLRIEYPGAMYHVMNLGDQREDIFRDDEDRQRFLSTTGEACGKTEWQVHAYCLMRNHFHLVLETPQPNLVFGMKWLLGVYTALQKAERIVQKEIQRLGWDEDELRARRKGDRAKVMLARRLRQEAAMSLKWIVQSLHMGTWTYMSNLLNEPPPTHPAAQEVLPLCQ
jgi:REP element-mobilizing transposase RayT